MILLLFLGCAEPPPPTPVDPAPRLIAQLTHESPGVRDAATAELIRRGPAVVPLLRGALERRDPELHARIRHILETIESYSFFPMVVGDRWVYASEGPDVVFQVLAFDGDLFSVERTVGDERLAFFLSVTPGGVSIHKVGEHVFNPPYVEFRFPLQAKDEWGWIGFIGDRHLRIDCRNDGIRRVKVPAGTYDGFHIVERIENQTTEVWLVEGLGVVKLQGKTEDLHTSTNTYHVWELKEFTRK